MWNPFRKKNKNSNTHRATSPANQPNRVNELANSLHREGRFNAIERELGNLDQSALSPAEQESWWHFYGIAAFHEGRDADALERFQEAYKRFPASAHIRFSLGQQYIRDHAIDKGFELFRTCKFPEVPSGYALAQARYAYVWSRYDDGLMFIRPFFETYKELRILDGHFLYVRGLPFFEIWWSYLAAFAILSGDLSELESVTMFVVENCHSLNFERLQKELSSYRNDRPDYLLEYHEKSLGNMPEGDFPIGDTRMKIAIIKARAAASIQDASELLTSVSFSEQDFPWLSDIRTLALAETAHRFGNAALEQEYTSAFLERQPLLFEPNIALNYHLLRYQENLKPMVAKK